MPFKTLGISDSILKALSDKEYETPTPIQEKTIPAALEGKDILGLAQTGTGKTAAFAIPTLQLLSKATPDYSKPRRIRTLVLTPTRELALQIQDSFKLYGKYLPLKSTVIYGGVGQAKQVEILKRGVDILVATPGRLLDLIQQGFIRLNSVEIFILDEADRMLDMGFIHDIRKVVTYLPQVKQTMLFSATMPKEIDELAQSYLHNPHRVSVTPVSSTVDTVEQHVVFIDSNHKVQWLAEFIKSQAKESYLVFARTKHGSDKVVKELAKHSIRAKAIHGNKSQNARVLALSEFKDLTTPVLVATDIASRGIDIKELKYVINYDLPEVPETYVHRIGRTGRAGKSGIAISLVNFTDMPLLKDIEKLIKKKVPELANPHYPLVDKTIKEKKHPQRPQKAASHKPHHDPKTSTQSNQPKSKHHWHPKKKTAKPL